MASNVNPILGTITDDLNNALSYTVGQCTRFVAGALSWIPPGLGNARDWFANAAKAGLPTIGPTTTPPPGSVAVWGTGAFGHVAEVVGTVPGGFKVAEENWRGPGITDIRDVRGSALNGLEGFILPKNGVSIPNPFDAVGSAVGGAAAGIGSAVATAEAQAAGAVATSVGHGLANATGAGLQNVATFARNQLVPLTVALVVALVLFGGDESK